MAEYRLKDPAHGLLGPVRLDTVRDLVKAGVISDAVLVSKDGGAFQPVRSFAELWDTPPPAPVKRVPTFSGDLFKNTFFKVFYRFHAHGATGLLELNREERKREVYLERGQPVYVASNIEGERIGEFLVDRGKLDEADLEVALEALPKFNNHLGQVLIKLGLIEPHVFFEELRELQILRLVDLCAWESGRYAFYDGVRHDLEKLDLSISASNLILRAVRAMDETLLQRRLQSFWRQPPRRVPHPELDRGGFAFAPAEQKALESIDGRRTVSEIVETAGSARERRLAALMLVYVLFEIDALSF